MLDDVVSLHLLEELRQIIRPRTHGNIERPRVGILGLVGEYPGNGLSEVPAAGGLIALVGAFDERLHCLGVHQVHIARAVVPLLSQGLHALADAKVYAAMLNRV